MWWCNSKRQKDEDENDDDDDDNDEDDEENDEFKGHESEDKMNIKILAALEWYTRYIAFS